MWCFPVVCLDQPGDQSDGSTGITEVNLLVSCTEITTKHKKLSTPTTQQMKALVCNIDIKPFRFTQHDSNNLNCLSDTNSDKWATYQSLSHPSLLSTPQTVRRSWNMWMSYYSEWISAARCVQLFYWVTTFIGSNINTFHKINIID